MASVQGIATVVIFTDLDGSLLDHRDYRYDEARPALERIHTRRLPLVFVSSKTRREIEHLQAEMGIREPFVSENGGGIFIPDGYDRLPATGDRRRGGYRVFSLGRSYADIRAYFVMAKRRYDIIGFGDLTAQDIADLTDLSLDAAERCKDREFTEPFLLDREDQKTALAEESLVAGYRITRGGRFHHLMGRRQDKGRAVRILTRRFRQCSHLPVVTLALGDSANDLPMLREADVPVLLRRHDGGFEPADLPRAERPEHPSSRGWNEAVTKILDDLGW